MPKITSVSYKKLVCVIKQHSFIYSRTKGDHLIYIKKDIIRPLVIPMYRQLPLFIIKNLIRTAGLTREEYLSSLKKC